MFTPFEPKFTHNRDGVTLDPESEGEQRREVARNAFRSIWALDDNQRPTSSSLEFEGCVYSLSRRREGCYEVRVSQPGCLDVVHVIMSENYNGVTITVYRGRVCVLGYWLTVVTSARFYHVHGPTRPLISYATNTPTILGFDLTVLSRWGDWLGDLLSYDYYIRIEGHVDSMAIDSYERVVILQRSGILWLTPDFERFKEISFPYDRKYEQRFAYVDEKLCLVQKQVWKNNPVFLTHSAFEENADREEE